ncbi:MAG: transcription-repair coupling factor, partial [Bacteroidia bacterium]|nr:transcription-repair coupling factor [Bacteroidia bacterium]
MKLEQLLKFYAETDSTLQVVQKLKSGGAPHVRLKGLAGSMPSFVVASAAQQLKKTHLCLLPNHETAAYFLNDIETIFSKKSVCFFPSSGRRPYEHSDKNNSNLLLRAETLNELITYARSESTRALIIVAYPESIAEKVVTRQHLSKNTLQVVKGEKLSVDFVVELISEYGFERVDYVLSPGQFSVRGGIIDVFSFSDDNPYRVELLGDEVESIRSFDPVTQLSIQQMESMTVIPNIQEKLLKESRQSFLEYIPADTIVWLNDTVSIADTIQKEVDSATKIFSNSESLIEQLHPDELYITQEHFFKQLFNFPCVEFGNRFHLETDLTIEYECTPQPAFNKNFEMLLDHLNSNAENNFNNIIFFDTEKQAERLRSIFSDLNKTNLHTDDLWTGIPLSVHEGFIDKQNKIACYTDHQVFGRYHRYQLKNSFSKTNEAITLK